VQDLRLVRAQTTPQEGPLLRGKPVPLFSDATHRREKQELRTFHGRTIAHKMRVDDEVTSKGGVMPFLIASGRRGGMDSVPLAVLRQYRDSA